MHQCLGWDGDAAQMWLFTIPETSNFISRARLLYSHGGAQAYQRWVKCAMEGCAWASFSAAAKHLDSPEINGPCPSTPAAIHLPFLHSYVPFLPLNVFRGLAHISFIRTSPPSLPHRKSADTAWGTGCLAVQSPVNTCSFAV